MSQDDASNFRPRTGRIGDRGGASRRPQSFVAQALKAAAKANGGSPTPRCAAREGAGTGGASQRPQSYRPLNAAFAAHSL